MREHQRYFSVCGPDGSLLPFFVTISNTRPKDPNVVIRGNERVLQARLADARFFFVEDQKVPFAGRAEGLKKVVYHSKLGTSYEKVMRIASLAEHLGSLLNPSLVETVKRASLLCKCDLITGMVGEFPTLQGVMGRVYARLSGEAEEVALAIYEHYLPTSAGGRSHPPMPGRSSVWPINWTPSSVVLGWGWSRRGQPTLTRCAGKRWGSSTSS